MRAFTRKQRTLEFVATMTEPGESAIACWGGLATKHSYIGGSATAAMTDRALYVANEFGNVFRYRFIELAPPWWFGTSPAGMFELPVLSPGLPALLLRGPVLRVKKMKRAVIPAVLAVANTTEDSPPGIELMRICGREIDGTIRWFATPHAPAEFRRLPSSLTGEVGRRAIQEVGRRNGKTT